MKVLNVIHKDGSVLHAKVDDDVFERLQMFNWATNSAPRSRTLYARASIFGDVEYLHQAILGKKPGFEIDHIDGDGLNNLRSNLRHVTRSENMIAAYKRLGNDYPRPSDQRGGLRWTIKKLADGSRKAYFYSKATGKRVPDNEAETFFPGGLPPFS